EGSLPAPPQAYADGPPGEALTHRLVLDRVGGEGGAIPVDVLAQLREPLGCMCLEPSRGVGDGAGESDRVDLARGEPALILELSHELVAVEALDLVDEGGAIEAIHVEHLAFHAPLDGRGQLVHRLDLVLSVEIEEGPQRQGLAEGDAHPASERLPRIEGEADGDRGQRLADAALPTPRLVVEGDARGARLDALDARLGVGRPLRVD